MSRRCSLVLASTRNPAACRYYTQASRASREALEVGNVTPTTRRQLASRSVVVAATAVVLLHAIGDSLLYLTKCFTLTVCGLIFTAIGDEVRIFLDHGGFKYHGEVFYAVSTKLVELYQRPGKIIHLFILKDFAEISGKYISSHANSIEHYWEERLYKLSECLSYFGLET